MKTILARCWSRILIIRLNLKNDILWVVGYLTLNNMPNKHWKVGRRIEKESTITCASEVVTDFIGFSPSTKLSTHYNHQTQLQTARQQYTWMYTSSWEYNYNCITWNSCLSFHHEWICMENMVQMWPYITYMHNTVPRNCCR